MNKRKKYFLDILYHNSIFRQSLAGSLRSPLLRTNILETREPSSIMSKGHRTRGLLQNLIPYRDTYNKIISNIVTSIARATAFLVTLRPLWEQRGRRELKGMKRPSKNRLAFPCYKKRDAIMIMIITTKSTKKYLKSFNHPNEIAKNNKREEAPRTKSRTGCSDATGGLHATGGSGREAGNSTGREI